MSTERDGPVQASVHDPGHTPGCDSGNDSGDSVGAETIQPSFDGADVGNGGALPRPGAERAAGMTRGAAPAPRELRASDPIACLAFETLRAQCSVLTLPEAERTSRPDADGVHRMRVAIRRARSALRVFRSVLPEEIETRFGDELKWLAAVLGESRDLDVYRELYLDYRAALAREDAAALAPYEDHLEAESARAAAALTEALAGDRYARLVDAMAGALSPPAASDGSDGAGASVFGFDAAHGASGELANATIRDAGRELIRAARKRILKRGRRVGRSPRADELHELRKEGKRFRYVLEFFAPFFDSDIGEARKSAVRLQDVLGAHQDAIAANARLRGYAEATASRGELLALGQLLAAQTRSADKARKRFRKTWRDFDRAVSALRPAGPG